MVWRWYALVKYVVYCGIPWYTMVYHSSSEYRTFGISNRNHSAIGTRKKLPSIEVGPTALAWSMTLTVLQSPCKMWPWPTPSACHVGPAPGRHRLYWGQLDIPKVRYSEGSIFRRTMVYHGIPWYTTVYHGTTYFTMVYHLHTRFMVYHGIPVYHGTTYFTMAYRLHAMLNGVIPC